MSLLQICRDAADEIGLDTSPVSIIGNPGVDERRLLRFATRVCRDLLTRAPWQALRVDQRFECAASEVQGGAVPSDFDRFCPETFWNRTTGESITGPVSPSEYQSRRSSYDSCGYYLTGFGLAAGGNVRWFTRRGDSLFIYPAPPAGSILGFEYQSKAFCRSASGEPQTEWLADTDEPVLSQELITLGVIAAFKAADGQPVAMDVAAFERRLRQEISNDAPAARVLVSADLFGQRRRFTGEPGVGGRDSSAVVIPEDVNPSETWDSISTPWNEVDSSWSST